MRRSVQVGSAVLVLGCCLSLSMQQPVASAEQPKDLNTLTDAEKSAGWKLLFDGTTTNGWRGYKRQAMPDKWKVIDGTLALKPKDGKQGGDLVTLDEYDNFELALEWKISPGGNSGIMYHVKEEAGSPYETGPEYQLLDNAKHPDGRSPLTSAASCYGLYAPSKDATKPVGEWNQTRLVINGSHAEHWLNGEKVVTYELGSD